MSTPSGVRISKEYRIFLFGKSQPQSCNPVWYRIIARIKSRAINSLHPVYPASLAQNTIDMGVDEVYFLVKALKLFEGMVGKEGPFFFDCQVVLHAWGDSPGEKDVFTIGEKGKLVTMTDIIETLDRVSNDETLGEWRYCGRSYFHEGYHLSKDGRTVTMCWGS